MHDFSYLAPATLGDALAALRDEEARPLAGGQTFLPVLKQRLNRPSAVVDLAGLGLAGIAATDAGLRIGAMTTHAAVAASPAVAASIPALARLAGMIGDRQVRNRGTIGGSLANNDPSACYPAAVLALNATIETDRRRIAADAYFQGMFTTALEPGELIVAVHFPLARRAAYEKFRNPASRYAMAGVFVAETASGVRVAVTGAGQNGVFRHAAAEAALGRSFTVAALDGVRTPSDGISGDMHASPDYRAHLVDVMLRRAVAGIA